MTKRDNFKKITAFETPERLIFDFCGCPLSGIADGAAEDLNTFLGFGGKGMEYEGGRKYPLMTDIPHINERILKYYDVDTRGAGWILRPSEGHFSVISDGEYVDEWGVRRKHTGLYYDIVESPLKDASLEDLKSYRFPNPESIDGKQLAEMAARAKYLFENTDYLVCASHPVYGIFELGCWMCGFDDFLYKMAAEPEFVHCFFERVLKYQKKVTEIYYKALGPYIHYTSSGDDFATQSSTFISTGMFDSLIAPYLKDRITHTKKFTKAKFLHHSCGNIESFIPSLIECGVDILNPVQPVSEQMKPAYLKEKYKNKIVFHGGYDTQRALPNNTPEQIDAEVKALADGVRKSGGFILAAAHNIQCDVSAGNINAFLDSMKKYK